MKGPAVTCVLVVALALAPAAAAAPGDLDERFSTDGLVAGPGLGAAQAVAVAPDGSVVIAGTDAGHAVVRRLRADGELDSSFGAQGVAGATPAYGRALALRADGRILLGGGMAASPDDFALAELAPGGQVRCGAGEFCEPTTDFGGDDRLYDVFAEAAGTTLAAGLSITPDGTRLAVARYLPSGALDPSFSGDGRLLFDHGGVTSTAEMAAVAGLPDGSVVLAGAGPGPDGSGRGDLLLAKLEPDGDLDPGFGGGDGWTTIDVANRDDASSLALAPDGAILVGIQACAFGLHTSCSSAVARFTVAGTPDPTFGGGGVVTPVPGTEVAVAPDGSAYLAGGSPVREHFQGDFSLARLTPAGTLDAALSGDGIATADFGLTHDFAFDVGLGPDGPVLAGAAGAGYGVARFELEAGPADADADGVEDADDRCPQRFAGNSSGCPRIDRTAKVRPARGGRLKVTLKSEVDACSAKQRITVIRQIPGPDGSFARPLTSRGGGWLSPKPVPEGRYRAIARRKLVPELGRCAQARSRARQVG